MLLVLLLLLLCRGTGVIREDPLESAWWPQQRPALHATQAAAQLHSGEAHTVSRQAVLRAHSAGQLAEASSGGTGGAPNGAESSDAGRSKSPQQQRQQQGILDQQKASTSELIQVAATAPSLAGSGGSSGSGNIAGSSVEQQAEEERRLEGMLACLQSLPWRRVDVCFGATALPLLSHQHIQVSGDGR